MYSSIISIPSPTEGQWKFHGGEKSMELMEFPEGRGGGVDSKNLPGGMDIFCNHTIHASVKKQIDAECYCIW